MPAVVPLARKARGTTPGEAATVAQRPGGMKTLEQVGPTVRVDRRTRLVVPVRLLREATVSAEHESVASGHAVGAPADPAVGVSLPAETKAGYALADHGMRMVEETEQAARAARDDPATGEPVAAGGPTERRELMEPAGLSETAGAAAPVALVGPARRPWRVVRVPVGSLHRERNADKPRL